MGMIVRQSVPNPTQLEFFRIHSVLCKALENIFREYHTFLFSFFPTLFVTLMSVLTKMQLPPSSGQTQVGARVLLGFFLHPALSHLAVGAQTISNRSGSPDIPPPNGKTFDFRSGFPNISHPNWETLDFRSGFPNDSPPHWQILDFRSGFPNDPLYFLSGLPDLCRRRRRQSGFISA